MRSFLLTLFIVFYTTCIIDADVIDLTESTFDDVVDGSTNVLVEFFAPWYVYFRYYINSLYL